MSDPYDDSILLLSMGATSMAPPLQVAGGPVKAIDIYDLPTTKLSQVKGIIIAMSADQKFLGEHAELFHRFIEAGGRVAMMGHPVVSFLPNQGDFRELHYSEPTELYLSPGDSHPVWEGVDLLDASTRKGITGFYARGYTLNHPPGALITTRIGPQRLPCDYVYTYGQGRILIHPGIELAVYRDDNNSAARLHPQLIDWLLSQ